MAAQTLTLQPIKGPQSLPGIASLALPLPQPSFPSPATSGSRSGAAPEFGGLTAIPSMHTLVASAPGPAASQQAGWVLAPASAVFAAAPGTLNHGTHHGQAHQPHIVWQPQQIALAVPAQQGQGQASTAAPLPDLNAALLASMLQQLQQHQTQTGSHFMFQPQQQNQHQHQHQNQALPEWSGSPAVATILHPAHPQQHGAAGSIQPFVAYAPMPGQGRVQESNDPLASMLHRLQQHNPEPRTQPMVLQTQDLSACLLRQHVQSTEPPTNMVPTFMSHLGSASCAGHEASARRLAIGCKSVGDGFPTSSSRSGSASTTVGATSGGSPSNSLSTLLACNELLKSQLHENERQIQHCQVAAAQKVAQRDGDPKDGDSRDVSDDDSSTGTSSISGASTNPSTKGAEGTPPAGHSRYWTEEEHRRFLEAVRCFGAHNHKAIASYVSTRNSTQVRSHSQKFFKKLETFRGRGLPTMLRKRKNTEGK